MPRRKLNYSEGDCFVLPLQNGGFARGIVARMDRKGGVFGYFFGPKLEAKESARIDATLRRENAVLVGQFGGLGLLKGEWNVIGHIKPWSSADWPMPPFFRTDALGKLGFICYYDDSLRFLREVQVKPDDAEARKLPRDAIMGYVAVEIHLTNLLGQN